MAGTKPTPPQNISKKQLYKEVSVHAYKAIARLVYEMEHGDNSNARTGAARALLNKVIPDLKAVEWSGDKDSPIPLVIIRSDGSNSLTMAKQSMVGQPQVQSDSSGEKVGEVNTGTTASNNVGK